MSHGRCFPLSCGTGSPSSRNPTKALNYRFMSSAPLPSTRATSVEPRLVRIPEGWFWMGSETGQDNERPVHRVWVDEFRLASCAATNAGYDQFVRATGNPPPLFCENPDFSHPEQPVVAVSWFEAVRYCEWLSLSTGLSYRLPTRLNGNGRYAAASKTGSIPGETARRSHCPTTKSVGRKAPSRWRNTRPTDLAFTTSARTCTSGAATGIRRAITRNHLSATQQVRITATVERRAAAPGAITSRQAGARPAPASLRNFITPTTDSAWRAISSAGVPPAVARASRPRTISNQNNLRRRYSSPVPARSRQPAEEHIDQSENDRSHEGGAERIHMEAGNNGRGQLDHGRVDDQPE